MRFFGLALFIVGLIFSTFALSLSYFSIEMTKGLSIGDNSIAGDIKAALPLFHLAIVAGIAVMASGICLRLLARGNKRHPRGPNMGETGPPGDSGDSGNGASGAVRPGS